MKEQKLTSWTVIHFDFLDRLRVLFGAKVHVKLDTIIPIENEILHYNCISTVMVDGLTKFEFKQDKPTFGYEVKFTHGPKAKQ